MADLKITGEVVVEADKAEAAFERLGNKAEKMGSDVSAAARKAGTEVDKMGDGAGGSAEKFTRSESRISDSIKRTTKRLEELGKTASQKLELKIEEKGLDPTKFESVLRKLREAEAAQIALAKASATAGAESAAALDKLAASARQTSSISDSIRRATQELQLLGKTASQKLEFQISDKGLDASKFEPLLKKLRETEAAQLAMAKAATIAAAENSAALEKIAASARQTSSITDSIKRATQELQLLGKTASQKLEFQIQDKGLNPAQFEPMLKKLREAEAAQLALAKASATAGTQGAAALDKIGISAKQTAAAMRGVPAQFTDIVTSLQGGQAPLTVLLQQGGQLKDMFGGVGNAARALGGYVLGLVNPFSVAAVAAAGLGFVVAKGQKEQSEYAKAIILSGNAAGVTTGQLQGYAQAISQVTGTQGGAAAALQEFVQFGKVGAENLQSFTLAAIKFEKSTGTAVSDTVKQFAELGKAPVDASVKLNDSINFLTVDLFKQINALESQGKATEAAALAQKSFADVIDTRAGRIVENIGTIEAAWKAVKRAITGAADAALNVGRAAAPKEIADDKRGQIANLEELISSGAGGAETVARRKVLLDLRKQELAFLTESEKVVRRTADGESERAAQTKAGIEFIQQGNKFLSDKQRLEKEIIQTRNLGIAAGLTEEVIQKRIADIREKANKGGSKSGLASGGENEVASIIAKTKAQRDYFSLLQEKGKLADDLTEGQKLTIKIQEQLKTSITGVARAEKERALVAAQELVTVDLLIQGEKKRVKAEEEAMKAATTRQQLQQKESDSIESYIRAEEQARIATVKSANESVAAAQTEYDNYGKTKSQIAEVTLARLKDQLAGVNAGTAIAESLEAQITAQKQLVGILASGEAREINDKAAKDAADEWKKTAESIQTSITDALLRGFESGKGFGKNLRDTIVNMFKTLVLRPTISAIVNPVAGAITSSLGLAGAANAATGGGGVGDMLSTGKSIYDAISGGFTKLGSTVTGQFANFATSSVGQSMGLSTSSLTGLGGREALTTTMTQSASSMATAAGSIAAAAGGIAAGLGLRGAISGDMSMGLGMDNFQKVGIAVAGAINPVLGAIAGAGMGVLNRAFGMGPKNTTAEGLSGKFGASLGADVQTYSSWQQKGGWFRSDKSGTDYAPVQEALDKFLDLSIVAIASKAKAYAAAVGASSEAVTNYTEDINVSLKGLTVDEQNKALDAAIGKFSDNLAMQVEGLSAYVREGESAGAVLTTMATALTSANAAFDLVNLTLFDSTLVGAEAATKLLAAFGGIEKFASGMNSYYANYFTEEEKRANTIKAITKTLNAAGGNYTEEGVGKASRKDFRAEFEKAGNTNEFLAAMVSVESAFAGLNPEIDSLSEALEKLRNPLRTAADIANSIFKLESEGANLQVQKLRAGGNDTQANVLQKAVDTKGFTAAETALYDFNEALRQQIKVVTEAKGLQERLNAATDTIAQAATRARESIDPLNQALYDSAIAAEKAKEVAAEAKGLQDQLNAARDTEAEAIERQRKALDSSNQALFDQLQAQLKINKAKEEEKGLLERLYGATDTTTQAAERARKAIDPLNQALYDTVIAAESSKVAMDSFGANVASTIAKFNTPEQNSKAQYNGIASQLKTAGIVSADYNDLAKDLQSASKAEIKKVVQSLFDAMGGGATVATEKLRVLADQLGDMKTAEAEEALKTAAETTKANLEKLAESLARFGSALNLRIDLEGAPRTILGTVKTIQASYTAAADGLQNLRPFADTYATRLAGVALTTTNALSLLFSSVNGGSFATDAKELEQELAKTGQGIGKNLALSGLSKYFADFGSGLTSLVDSLSTALTDGSSRLEAGLVDSNNMTLNGVTLDQLGLSATGLTGAGTLGIAGAVGDAATLIGQTLSDSLMSGVSESIKGNTAFADLLGPDLARLSAIISGVAKDDVQGLNDAFLLLTGSLADGAINSEQYTAAVGLVNNAFKNGAAGALESAETVSQAYLRLVLINKTNEQIAQERISLEQRYYAATDTAAQALERARAGVDQLNQAFFDTVVAAEAAKAVADERKTLQEQLNALTDTAAQALSRQRDALDESNRALFDQIQAIKERQAIDAEALTLQKEWYQITGNTTALREDELKGINEVNQALKKQIYAYQDQQAALEKATGVSDAALSDLQKSVDAQKTAQSSVVAAIKGVFDTIKSEVAKLYQSVDSTRPQAIAEANAFIDTALALAKAGGTVPDQSALSAAIAAAQSGFGAEGKTPFESDSERLILAGKLSQLNEVLGPQLTTAEQQLAVTTNAYDLGKSQLDELRGNTRATLSIAEAVEALQVAMTGEKTERQKMAALLAQTTPAGVAGGNAGRGEYNPNYASGIARWAAASASMLQNSIGSLLGAGITAGVAAMQAELSGLPALVAQAATDQAQHASELGIDGSHANGLAYVPFDNYKAKLHQGERVLTKSENQKYNDAPLNTAALEALIEKLIAKVDDGNRQNKRTADAVNGNAERPQPVVIA